MNDPLPTELVQDAPEGTYLINPYEDWAKAEGVPIHTGATIDLLKADLAPWARFDVKGALCHIDGRCDFLTVFLMELATGASSAPQTFLMEQLCLVLEGSGETDIETAEGSRTISWGARSLLSVPMNARHTHRNTGSVPARIAVINDMRYVFNLFRNEDFVFANAMAFPERQRPGVAEGGSDAVVDIPTLALSASVTGSAVQMRTLTFDEGSIGADVWELAPGACSDVIRQLQGMHIFGVSGEGRTVTICDETGEPETMNWHHGILAAAPSMQFYQQFNTGEAPARFLTAQLGSQTYPMFRHRRKDYGDDSVYAAGFVRIPALDQRKDIREPWLDELRGKGITPQS